MAVNLDYPKSEAGSSTASLSITPPDHVVILYASETGNAQDVAERVAREFRRVGGRCLTMSMDMFNIFDLPHTQLLILITSTHGRGDPPPAMKPLWEALIRSSLPEDILEDVQYALYGLGDSSYEKFCYAGKMLARRMDGLSAVKLGEPAWGDERAPDGIEETFLPWLQETVDGMLSLLPRPSDGFIPQAPEAIPFPIYAVDFEDPVELNLELLELDRETKLSNGHTPPQTAPIRSSDSAKSVRGDSYKPNDWAWAILRKNQRVTKTNWWQDVREIELELEDETFADYAPASICSLQPKNDPEEVNRFIEMMDLEDIADATIRIRSAIDDQPLPSHLPAQNILTTLRILLTDHLDLRSSPYKSFFEWLRRFSSEETERDRLDEFIADPDEIHDYATRPSRSILETLADFRHTKIPVSHLCEVLPPLRRRQFSIASSSSMHPGKIQLLIALVEYKTNLKIARRGLCSSWLEKLEIGTRIPVTVNLPTLPSPEATDYLILVGPGTGVAPMRAFVEERVRQGAAHRTILYFGCRSIQADYYYASEWERYRALGLQVMVAGSRDQEEKIYVQDLIKRNPKLIKGWIVDRRSYLYVSGSSNAMPRQVREAIAWCISVNGSGDMPLDRALDYVEEMFEDGRGAEESWCFDHPISNTLKIREKGHYDKGMDEVLVAG